MNNVQIPATIAPIVAFIAGLLAGKGVFGFDYTTWMIVLGGAAAAVMPFWTAYTARKNAVVSAAAGMPEVKEITLDRTVEGSVDLNTATPANVVIK